MNKKILTAVLSLLMLGACASAPMSSASSPASAAASSATATAASFQVIKPEEAKKMMDAGGVIIVDVRRQDEYDAGHIPNAILIPNESIGNTEIVELPNKDAVILVYCRTGVRAKEAAGKLADLGYTNIYDFGGITTWPYDTVK